MNEPVIVLDELTKSYGKHRGIENISFSVAQGEIFGFIGPNGAGKSTTIRTLMGLLKPDDGKASIFGLDCGQYAAEIAKNVGYLPSENCYSYAIYLGVSCVAKETVHGTAEYLFTKPIRRSKIVAAKALSGVCNLLILTVFSGLCGYFTAILPLGGLEQPGAAVTTTIGMFLTEVVLFAIGLLISSLVRTYKNAARLGAGVLLGFYGLYVIADYLEMPALHYLTPLKYFDVYAMARGGFSVSFLMISIVIVICAVAKSQRSWASREI